MNDLSSQAYCPIMFSYVNTLVNNELSGMDFYEASAFADAVLFFGRYGVWQLVTD
jgi:hypothetical protein